MKSSVYEYFKNGMVSVMGNIICSAIFLSGFLAVVCFLRNHKVLLHLLLKPFEKGIPFSLDLRRNRTTLLHSLPSSSLYRREKYNLFLWMVAGRIDPATIIYILGGFFYSIPAFSRRISIDSIFDFNSIFSFCNS